MIPPGLEDEWCLWKTPAPDPRFGIDIAPFDVVTQPYAYGHHRPSTLRVYGASTIIPLALVPLFRAANTTRRWDEYTVYCDPPADTDFIDDVFSLARLCVEPWVPIMVVPLDPEAW